MGSSFFKKNGSSGRSGVSVITGSSSLEPPNRGRLKTGSLLSATADTRDDQWVNGP